MISSQSARVSWLLAGSQEVQVVKEVEIISSPVGARYRDLALSNGQIHERRSMEIQFKEPNFRNNE